MDRRIGFSALAALLVLAVASTPVLAGHNTSSVDSYTGCLNTGAGTLTRVAQGNAPMSPCTGAQKEIHLSGGDITEVVAGEGLTGGGFNASVELALAIVPAARVRAEDPITIDEGETPADEVPVLVPLDLEVFDTADMHDGTVDPELITAPRDGIYVITASVLWCTNPNGVRRLGIVAMNDSFRRLAMSRMDAVTADGFGDTAQSVSAVALLHEGESVAMEVATTQTCALSVSDENSPVLAMAWLGPAPPPPLEEP